MLEFLKGKDDIFKSIPDDRTKAKHKFRFSFNAPEEINYTELDCYFFGENTVKLVEEGLAFSKSLGSEFNPKIDANKQYCDIFCELKIKMKPGLKLKYEEFIK